MFLDGLPYFRRNIARDHDLFCGNEDLFRRLDERIESMVQKAGR